MLKILASTLVAGAALAAAATAAAPVTVTLVASAPVVNYGKPVTLSGVLSTKRANQTIAVEATECGSTRAVKVATVKTVANGVYTTPATPAAATTYQATFKNVKSAIVTVAVRPVLQLTRVARGSYTAKVTVGKTLKDKAVLFQRYSTLRKRWVQVKRVLLTTEAAGPAKPTVVDSASFRAKVALRARVRLLISTAQATPCFLTATSNVLRA